MPDGRDRAKPKSKRPPGVHPTRRWKFTDWALI